MALNNHVEKFTLDMAPGGIAPVLNVSQGDIGRTFTADMYWAGTSYDVSGLTVRLRGRKRDNTVFDYALSAPSGSEVTFETQEQMTIIPGNVECELVFTDSNSRVVGTANFVFIVEESPYDPNAISESEVTGLVDLISDQIGGAVDDWMETEAPTSPEFAAAMQNATDAYLDEHGVVINYDDVVGAPDADKIQKYIDGFDDIADWVEETTTTAVDGVTWTSGYKQANGTTASNTGYVYSDVFSVQPGDVVEVFAVTGSGATRQSLRFQCAYNGETVVTSAGSNTQTNTYTVPEGIDGLSVTVASTYADILEVRITRTSEHAEVTGLSELGNRVTAIESEIGTSEKTAFLSATADTLTSGQTLILEGARNALKKSQRLVFECTGVPDTLYIGMSNSTTPTLSTLHQCIKLDSDNLGFRNNLTDSFNSVAHGLTLSDNVQIVVESTAPQNWYVTVISGGQLFRNRWNSQSLGSDAPTVLLENGTVTNAKLTYTSADFNKKIWLYGDSYMSMASNDRWVYYLSEYNYIDNVLINAYSGEPSIYAFSNCNKAVQRATPKFILWAVGMNDGSDSATAPAANWVTYRDQFITLCESNGVTPIFATIPTVPTVNNEKKNEWVRNSGYRFVDFAKAVGADGTGAWFTGMLSSDNVHPSQQGARALYARALLDFPEIMISD